MPPGELLRCARGGPRLRAPPQGSDKMEGTGVSPLTDTSTFTSPWTDRYACTCERAGAAAGVAGAGQHACIFVAACVAGPPSRDERACTRSGRDASARSNLAASVLRRCAPSCLSCVCAHAVPGTSWCASVSCRDVGDGARTACGGVPFCVVKFIEQSYVFVVVVLVLVIVTIITEQTLRKT